MSSNWQSLHPADARSLAEARLQAHHAAQLASALGISFLWKQPDDSHTNLEWLPGIAALASNPVRAGSRELRVAVVIADLSLLVLESGRIHATQPLHGRTMEQGAAWLREQLASAGLDAGRVTLARHYEIPAHPVADGRAFDASARAPLEELARWFHDGALCMDTVRSSNAGASTVRCWPHHFDIGTFLDLGGGKSVGAGMEPGDVSYDEPYFYVNLHPAPDAEALPGGLEGGGVWHTRGWIGAVLPGSRVRDDATRQQEQCAQFLASAVRACRTLLGAPVR